MILCQRRYGKFVCEMSGNLNFVSRLGKTENRNNCWKGLKHKCMVGFIPGNDLVIICLPKLIRSPNICFSPLLTFLSVLYWSLISSNVLNDGWFFLKGTMEKFYYVECVEIWTFSQGRKTSKMETTAESAWSTCAWLSSQTWQWPDYYMPFKSSQIFK